MDQNTEVEEIGVYKSGQMGELIQAATLAERFGKKVCIQIARGEARSIVGVRLAIMKETAAPIQAVA